ncbi:glycosyltransferase family 2 protein [Aureisphaera galaxeae]|uniref:glycosyltransferase family 2 protein n=1 Tax=Aureisphaera galaxeae TaxID=1538023 RepID=UPI00235025C1|nr:glycosyltransferase family 2 protein [Aureisphaera galaxeae]MDC8006300.1 glycosyltransferase family 2 protein [Aureisphaera galaxeae]
MKNPTEKISVVVPIYRNEATLVDLVERLQQVFVQLGVDGEILLVNDSSPDDSWTVIKKMANDKDGVVGLNLSRNFGQHYAISAGLANATGDWVVVMDADLQDVPEEIEKLHAKAQEGFEIVLAQRSERKDGWFKKLLSSWFYGILSYLSGTPYDGSVANFGIYNKKVIDTIVDLPEKNRFFPSMIKWVGYTSTSIPVRHSGREEGSSSYNFRRRMNLALDIILSYSDKPLRLAIKLGILFVGMSSIFAIIILIKWLNGSIEVMGYTSLILSVWFLSGIIILVLGVSGLYIGKIFENVKDRPTYIIKEKV